VEAKVKSFNIFSSFPFIRKQNIIHLLLYPPLKAYDRGVQKIHRTQWVLGPTRMKVHTLSFSEINVKIPGISQGPI